MDVATFIVNFLISLVSVFFLLMFVNVILGIKASKKNMAYFIFFYGIVTGLGANLLMYFNLDYLKPFSTAITFIIFAKIFLKHEIWKYIVLYCIFLLITMAAVNIDYMVFHNYFQSNDVMAKDNLFVLITVNIGVYVFYTLILVIIRTFKFVSLSPKDFRISTYLSSVLNILFITFIMFSVMTVFYYNQSTKSFIVILVILCTLLLASYLVYTMFTTRSKLETNIRDLEYQRITNITLEGLLNDLRTYKHNYGNTINIIRSLAELGNTDQLKQYLNEVTADVVRTNTKQVVLQNIKNPEILALLTNKTEYAYEKNVDFNVMVKDEIAEINMRTSKLCEILYILLDNAIEAAETSKSKFVIVVIEKSKDKTSFSIKNSTRDKVKLNEGNIFRSEIFQKGFSTKGTDRGLGLWIIKDIISKNQQLSLDASVQEFEEESKFTVTLSIKEK